MKFFIDTCLEVVSGFLMMVFCVCSLIFMWMCSWIFTLWRMVCGTSLRALVEEYLENYVRVDAKGNRYKVEIESFGKYIVFAGDVENNPSPHQSLFVSFKLIDLGFQDIYECNTENCTWGGSTIFFSFLTWNTNKQFFDEFVYEMIKTKDT